MGRSSGGGSHSSGGFGGGHSSGGFSGGGRSHSSSYHSSNSSYQRQSHYNGGPHIYFGGPRYFGGGYSPRYRRRSSMMSIVILIIILLVSFAILMPKGNTSSSIPQNTTERVPLSGVVQKTDWYQDDIGWIRNRNVLIDGLEDFYKETGVQPYVMLIPYADTYWNGNTLDFTNADAYLENIYTSHFNDEGHFIFAYFACQNDSESEMDGEFRYLSGYSADTIMDNEALKIFWGHFEKNYYNTSLSIEEMISDTFRDTASSIMSRPTNGWDFAKIAVIVGGGIAVIVVIYMIIKTKAQREKEKEEYTKEILDKPLETFGTDTSDLEEKYK